jgi:predicted  nucleic acid-binding Zn-ribbon protein
LAKLEQRFEKLEKKNLPLSASIAKTRSRLDASQNALRVVEQAIGGKLVESKPHRKSHV